MAALARRRGRAQEVAVVEGEAIRDGRHGVERGGTLGGGPQRPSLTRRSDLNALLYVARPVIVFADNPNQPEFRQQMQLFQADLAGLDVRDVILIVDTDPAARTAIRQHLRPRGFNLVLIDKDGRGTCASPNPGTLREISRQIDKMPLRLQEIREGCRRAKPSSGEFHDDVVDLQACAWDGVDLFHSAAAFGAQDVFHLHRLDRAEGLTFLYLVAFATLIFTTSPASGRGAVRRVGRHFDRHQQGQIVGAGVRT